MRKILASFLAAAMVASVGATMTFATNKSASFTVNVSDNTVVTVPAGASFTLESVDIKIDAAGKVQTKGVKIGYSAKNGDKSSDLAKALAKISWNNIDIDGKRFDLNFSYSGNGSESAPNDLTATFTPAAELPSGTSVQLVLHVKATGGAGFGGGTVLDSATGGGVAPDYTETVNYTGAGINLGSGDDTADIEMSDTMKTYINVENIIECDGQGNPIVMTEHPEGVDKDQNSEDGVQSNNTVYIMLKKGAYNFDDDTYWKLKLTKGDNGKYVKKLSDVSKNFSKDLYNVVNGAPVPGTGGTRHRYIKVELNEIYTDDEYKITLDMRLTPKSKAVDVYPTIVSDSDEFKVKDFYFYMKNMVKDADNDWKVGINGLMLNPLENDWNDVTWYDEDGDVAHMKFFADSDVDKFYSKLSTKWEHADYASYFNDQDAFIFNFTGSPKLSSTSRANLEIYNPFVDEDGNETIDPASAVIYQVIDGDLYDVTDSWKYEEGENGDMAFTTRTRFLGTYIICEKPVEEAVSDDETVPDELTPDTTPEAPEDTTPDNNGGGKAPANTGKYL